MTFARLASLATIPILIVFPTFVRAVGPSSIPTDGMPVAIAGSIASSTPDASAITPIVPTAPAPAARPNPIDRWVDLKAVSFSFRWRSQFSTVGYHWFEDGQQKSVVDGRIKLDPAGNYLIGVHLSSGKTFNWSYSDEIGKDFQERIAASIPFGTPTINQQLFSAIAVDPVEWVSIQKGAASRGWGMHLRQLYFSATPVKQISVEYGSLFIEKGLSTEATSYDDDGYIAGERIRLHDPKHLFFDEADITYAYLGDLYQTSFLQRSERLGQSNYHQFLFKKRFSDRLNASVDYTFDKKAHILRQAALVKLPQAKVLDTVRVEFYERLNDVNLAGVVFHAHNGFAVTATKKLPTHLTLEGGFAHVDNDYGVLTGNRLLGVLGFSMNGDAFLTGDRPFTRVNWQVHPLVNLFGYYTHQIDIDPTRLGFNKQGLNFGMTVDFKSLLSKKSLH